MTEIKYLSVFLVMFFCFNASLCKSNLPKIAIIGGGIGGTSTAYFLRDLFGVDTTIDLYEPNEIGGRLATVSINNNSYETGGAIIHPRNKYMVDFLKLFDQKKRKNVFSKFAIHDGNKFLYSESDWEVISIVKLLWRYGYGPIKLQSYINDLLTKFSRIYKLQANGQCYTTVTDLIKAMSPQFVEGLTTSTKTGFMRYGFSEEIIDELIAATLTANYGQNTSVHEFVGLVSVAGASSGLWAVEGGNKRIPEELLSRSDANLIDAKISKVVFNPDVGDYTLEIKNDTTNNSCNYDIVIMATPLTSDITSIEFENLPKTPSFPGEYHRTVCTIVNGIVDYTYFGFKHESEMIDEILFVNFDSFFHSLGRINAVNDQGENNKKSNVWKMFSLKPIEDDDLKKLFMEIDSVSVSDWLAYPEYDSQPRNDGFILNKNLYHVNAIEWAASAMEMSIIGGKNVALLAHKSWNGLQYTDSAQRFGNEL